MKKILPLVALSALPIAELAAQEVKRPNIILIMCDDLMDYGGLYGGHPQAQTPNMDRISKDGVRFSNAHSVAPLSGPSRAAIFTGIYPHESQNYKFVKWYTTPVLSNCKTFMGQLKEEGYKVYGTGKLLHDNLKSEYHEFGYGYSQGPWAYDGKTRVLHPSVPEAYAKAGGILDGVFASLADVPTVNGYTGWWDATEKKPFRYVNDDDRDLMGDEKIAKWAVEKLEELAKQKDGEPFYLGVGFSKPHTALVAPQKYFDMYPLESIKLPDWVENDKDDTYFEEVAGRTAGYKHFKGMQAAYGENIREGFRRYLQAYLACVSFADDQVGKVLDAIDKSPDAENTIVIFTSDHGYDFGQRDHFFKNSLWSTSTQVPFVVRMPDKKNGGEVCNYPIALTDLYPTVIDYAQIKGDNRKNDKGAKLSGHSIRTFIEDPKAKSWGGSPVALSVVAAGSRSLLPQGQNYAVKGERYRYIHYVTGKEELYDCEKDPFEVHNLAGISKYAKVKREMRRELKRLVPELDDPIPAK